MKFRIWNKQLGKFVSEDEWFINGKGEVFFHDIMDHELVNADSNNMIIQIFTGSKDKNGKAIYEGDILLYREFSGVVNLFAGMFIIDYEDQTDSGPIGFLTTEKLEVIGNIFEK